MNNRIVALILAAALMLSVSVASVSAAFLDVPKSHQNYVAIDYLQKNNIVRGTGDGKFAPGRQVNRAEALKMIFEGAGITPDEEFKKSSSFDDVKVSDWFSAYVELAKRLEVIVGNGDGTFSPNRGVAKAEFIKMMLETYRFNKKDWASNSQAKDIPEDAWFAPYMNYATFIGLVQPDDAGKINPSNILNRAEVAEIIYLMTVIRKGNDNQFLLSQAEMHISQIEAYVGAKNILMSKRSSELAVDMTQQAYKNLPDNNVVLGAAKIARAYDYVLDAYIAGLQDNHSEALKLANSAITKASEAWEVNKDTQPIARHIKNRANEIINQIENKS